MDEEERQLSLFEFVSPNEIERGEIPTDEEIKQILTLGLLSTFTNKFERATDRNKSAEVLGKLHGLFVEKKDINLNTTQQKVTELSDDELERVISGG